MRKIFLFCISALLLPAAHAQHTVLIRQVNIVDVEKGKVIKNAHVLIRDSIIADISTGQSTFTADTIINGNNHYLLPGLWDMHTHVWSDSLFFPLLLANGVTGIRDMAGSMKNINKWRMEIASGKTPGPRIIAAGPIVDGPVPVWAGISIAVKDAEMGRRTVDSLKNKVHTDFIKVYSLLPRESYFAIATEANKQHIPFAGHVPNVVTITEAARAGQKSQEHLNGFIEAASDSADYYMKLVQQKIIDTTLNPLERRLLIQRTYNPKKLKQVLQEIKQYDTWICPTLTVNYNIGHLNDTSLVTDPRVQYLPYWVTGGWKPANDFRFRNFSAESFKAMQQAFELKLKMIKPIYDAGIPLLAGTDFPNAYCFPGFSLHDELQWLEKGGLTPAQALQTATINAVRYLNLQNEYGTVATGKMADLVLLQANPLTNISNTQAIETVIVHGKVFDKTALDNMLEKAKKRAGR